MNRFGRPTPVRCAEVAVEIRKISGFFAKTFHTAAKILFLHGVFLNYVFYRLMGHAGLAQIEVFKILKTASGNVIDVIEIIPNFDSYAAIREDGSVVAWGPPYTSKEIAISRCFFSISFGLPYKVDSAMTNRNLL